MSDDYTPREMRLIAERDAALSRAEVAEGNVQLVLTLGQREIEALRGKVEAAQALLRALDADRAWQMTSVSTEIARALDNPRERTGGQVTSLGLLNFVVLQWFGVRLARRYRVVHDIPPGEFAGALEQALHRVLSNAYGVEAAGPPPKSYPTRMVTDGWSLLRWVWPLTGWWSDYRWIARRP